VTTRSLAAVTFIVVAASAAPARAELVFLSNGRTLSVKAYRIEGTSVVLTLRSGGEIICDASVVARIEPDEIPYPEEVVVPTPDPRDDESEGSPFTASPQLISHAQYDALIISASARHGIDPTLVRAVIQVESNYHPRARSSRGARGLMQVMPATGRQYGVSNLYDPAANIEAGIRHLKALLQRFPLKMALAAYNAGEATVQRFGGIPPFSETETYVNRILELVGLS
jgi:Transglycosylase SLT domain